MAARSIGAKTFTVMLGRPRRAGQVVEELPRAPGEDFHRYRKAGMAAALTQILTTTFEASAADARTEATACKALQATSVTVIDPDLQEYDNCMILAATPRIRVCIYGGAVKYRVSTAWRIRQGDPT